MQISDSLKLEIIKISHYPCRKILVSSQKDSESNINKNNKVVIQTIAHYIANYLSITCNRRHSRYF